MAPDIWRGCITASPPAIWTDTSRYRMSLRAVKIPATNLDGAASGEGCHISYAHWTVPIWPPSHSAGASRENVPVRLQYLQDGRPVSPFKPGSGMMLSIQPLSRETPAAQN